MQAGTFNVLGVRTRIGVDGNPQFFIPDLNKEMSALGRCASVVDNGNLWLSADEYNKIAANEVHIRGKTGSLAVYDKAIDQYATLIHAALDETKSIDPSMLLEAARTAALDALQSTISAFQKAESEQAELLVLKKLAIRGFQAAQSICASADDDFLVAALKYEADSCTNMDAEGMGTSLDAAARQISKALESHVKSIDVILYGAKGLQKSSS